MRHRKLDHKLGRTTSHRQALLASLVGALLAEKRIVTTLPKAKAAQRLAEQMVTTARAGTLAARRRVIARLRKPRLARELFDVVVPALAGRAGGCTRITRIGIRRGDGAQTACLEWVGIVAPDKRRKPKPTEPTKKP